MNQLTKDLFWRDTKTNTSKFKGLFRATAQSQNQFLMFWQQKNRLLAKKTGSQSQLHLQRDEPLLL